MKQRKLNIHALLLLFAFLLGTIGVNVSKVYCDHCQESYLHVMVVPAETPCSCSHGCVCCSTHHNVHKKACDDEKQHTYYKVSGDWAVSNFEVQFCDMVQNCSFTTTFANGIISVNKPSETSSLYIDTSPSLELLCIFRC